MKRHFRHSFTALVASFAMMCLSSQADETQLPEKYRMIIDKNLFGPPPADPSALPEKGAMSTRELEKSERETAKELEKLEKTVYVSALNVSPNGELKVGFADTSDGKKPSFYYLAVGETKDGWLVVSADAGTKKVVLAKDGVEIERVYGEKNASAAQQGAQQGLQTASNQNQKSSGDARSSLLSGRLTTSSGGRILGGRGYLSRRAMRRQTDENERLAAQQREESRNKAAEEARQRDRDETERRLQVLRDEVRSLREANAAGQADNGYGEVRNRE